AVLRWFVRTSVLTRSGLAREPQPFPTRRSSDLPILEVVRRVRDGRVVETLPKDDLVLTQTPQAFRADVLRAVHADRPRPVENSGDRKSTRLNSSHVKISYAVFCLKKKNT